MKTFLLTKNILFGILIGGAIATITSLIITNVYFLHAIDRGISEVTVNDLNNNISSKNLNINACILASQIVSEESYSYKSQRTNYSYYLPIVPSNWQIEDSIHAFLKLTGPELDQINEKDEALICFRFNGTLRNILWEGISDDVANTFSKKFKIDKNALLIEYGKPSNFPLYLWGFVFLISTYGFITIVIQKNKLKK